jgi:hypothetical protein
MTDNRTRNQGDTASRLAELRGGGRGTLEEAGEPMAVEAEEAKPSYSTLSADRMQKVMLELRYKTGNAKALAYSYLVGIDFDPSEGIVLDFSGHEVRISGRNLGPLFSGLTSQRVAVVQEVDDLYAEATSALVDTVVTQIVVRELKP